MRKARARGVNRREFLIQTGLSAGAHTIVVTKLSGTYAVLDGFGVTSA